MDWSECKEERILGRGLTVQTSSSWIVPVFLALLENSAIFMRGFEATGGREGIPAVVKRCSSTKSTPHTNKFMFLTGPPPILQFTSINLGPLDVYFNSTWKTPCTGAKIKSNGPTLKMDRQLVPIRHKDKTTGFTSVSTKSRLRDFEVKAKTNHET